MGELLARSFQGARHLKPLAATELFMKQHPEFTMLAGEPVPCWSRQRVEPTKASATRVVAEPETAERKKCKIFTLWEHLGASLGKSSNT